MMNLKKWYWLYPSLVGILITFWGEADSPNQLIHQSYFLTNLGYNILASYIYLGFIWSITYYWFHFQLNKKHPRFFLFLFTISCCGVLIWTLAFLYLEVYWNDPLSNYPELFHTDMPIYLFLAVIFQLYLVQPKSQEDQANAIPEKAPEDLNPYIIAKNRKQTTAIQPTTIAACYLKNGIVYLLDFQGQHKIVDLSLNQLKEKLPASHFFQANRQLIINSKAITGYEELPTRKLKLHLQADITIKTTVSKAKASRFKRWWLEKNMSASASASARFGV